MKQLCRIKNVTICRLMLRASSRCWLNEWMTGRCSVVNYINAPKENGYQSFHIKLLNDQGGWEEIHISSERMVRNSSLGCTAERTEENVKAWLEKFKAVLKDVACHNREMDYMDGVTTSFYNDDIMVFTPQGKGHHPAQGCYGVGFCL